MKEKVFIDTNILIYHFIQEPVKYQVTNSIIANSSTELVTSTKVLSEFANICIRKKFVKSVTDVKSHIEAISKLFTVVGLSKEDILLTLDVQKHYKISFYDALIVSAALNAACNKLYTEDLHHGLNIQKQLKIVNPFK